MLRRWTLACALGAALAALLTTLLGALVSQLAPEDGAAPWALALLLPLVGVLEGATVGAVQAQALRPLGIPRARWTAGTAAAFGVVWLAGGVLSALEPARPPSIALVLVAAALAGGLVGAAAGLAQARVAAFETAPWVGASALAWSAAMVVGALVSEHIWGGFSPAVLGMEVGKGALGGLAVGATSGPTLRRLVLR
ncbi:MAG: hypothetical protein KF901_06485 [Myxococcales bacterium]|nr:hypothetical protein [Myxococcales bacterium]